MNRTTVIALFSFIVLMFAGCSSVPKVKLDREVARRLDSIRIVSETEDAKALKVLSTVTVHSYGMIMEASAGDGRGIGPKTLDFMQQNNIRLADIVKAQFEQALIDSGIPLKIDQGSDNVLRITLNVVVIGMKHGLSRELNCRFNITGELLSPEGEILWAYNAIPFSPIAPGYSLTPEEIFASKESFIEFLKAGSAPTVEKLFKDFAQAYK